MRTSQKSIPALARDLGVSDRTLRNWQCQAVVDAGQGRPGELTSAERDERGRLRREVKVLQQERESLGKVPLSRWDTTAAPAGGTMAMGRPPVSGISRRNHE